MNDLLTDASSSGQTFDQNLIAGNFYCSKSFALQFQGESLVDSLFDTGAIRDDFSENSLLAGICQKAMQLLRLFLLAKPKKELKTEACEDINEFGFSSILEKEIKGLFFEE